MSEKVSFVYGMMVEERNKYYVMLSSIIKTAFSILDLKDAQKTFRSEKKKGIVSISLKKIGYYLLFNIVIISCSTCCLIRANLGPHGSVQVSTLI